MKIAALPKSTSKIFASKGRDQTKVWNRLLKKVDDKSLLSIIHTLLYSRHHVQKRQWQFAGIALNELTIRPWATAHDKELEFLRDAMGKRSKLCFSSRSYSIETGGLRADQEVLHPYAFSSVAKKVRDQWQLQQRNKSLNSFIYDDIDPEDAHFLKTHTISYVPPEKLPNYLVTFDKGKVKVGNKTPKDAWYMFVLDATREHLHAAIKVKGTFHHTSLTQGIPIACAGEFKVQNGKIVRITLRSGHYKPKEEHGRVLQRYLMREENLGRGEWKRALLRIEPYEG